MKHPRFRFLLQILLFTIPVLSYAQWKPVYHGTDTTNEITGISFYSLTEGYVASRSYIGFTNDGGNTFIKKFITLSNVDFNNNAVNLTFGFQPDCIKAFDQNRLLVGGEYGLEPAILFSSNGGATWKLVYHKNIPINTYDLINTVHEIHFTGSLTGFAVQKDEIIKTTDGGQTWSPRLSAVNLGLKDMSFGDAVTGYAISGDRIFTTTNGGDYWYPLGTAPGGNKQELSFVNASTGYLFSNDTYGGKFFKTTNSGNSWLQMNVPEIYSPFVEDMLFVNPTTGFILTPGYGIYKTNNSGKNWELCKGSTDFTYLGFHFSKLFFFNEQTGWAGGYHDYLVKTVTGGDPTVPAAHFKINKTSFCATGMVQLENFSRSGYNYQWFLNDSLFSTGYNSSYQADGFPYDTIMLVVSNGMDSDTSVQVTEAQRLGAFTFVSKVQADTVCMSRNFYFEIPNSEVNTFYRLHGRNWVVAESYGNGGVLRLYTESYDTVRQIQYRIEARRTTSCGSESKSNYHNIYFIPTYINVVAKPDTICSGIVQYVKVLNSIQGYEYWVNNSNTHVPGNGGVIDVPVTVTSEFIGYDNGPYQYLHAKIYAKHTTWGCTPPVPHNEVKMIIRDPVARMHLISYEVKTGQSITVRNSSVNADSYLWKVNGTGVINNESAQFEPSNISFSQAGNYNVSLISTSKHGCADTSFSKIEVYDASDFNNASIPVCKTDSMSSGFFYKALDNYKDASGNLYITGARMKLDNYFSTKGLEGWFLIKKDKNGVVQWEKNNLVHVGKGHMVTENLAVDQYENVYLFGHLFRDPYPAAPPYNVDSIFFGGGSSIAFITKLNKNGRVVWMRTATNFSRDPRSYPSDEPRSFAAGSMVLGKNNEVFLKIASDYAVYNFGDTMMRGGMNEEYLFHFNQDGKLLDYKRFESRDASWDIKTLNHDVYHHSPRMKFDPSGRLVFTGVFDSTKSVSSFEGISLSFDTRKINTALLIYDTAQKKFVSILPVYKDQSGIISGTQARQFTVDASGNYYTAAFNRTLDTMPPGSGIPVYPVNLSEKMAPSYKLKTYISKFNVQGNLLWQKLVDGLNPVSLFEDNNQLMIIGENFQTDFHRLAGHSFNNNIGIPYYHSNRDTLFVGYPSGERKKISFLTSNTGEKLGIEGSGGIDLLMITMNGDGSGTQMKTLGTENDERLYSVSQDNCGNILGIGIKDLIGKDPYFGYYLYEQTSAEMMIWNFSGSSGCSASPCLDPKPALRFEQLSTRYKCVDTIAKLFWSASNIEKINISYSRDGVSYETLVQDYPADSLWISYNPKVLNLTGQLTFRIQSSINSVLADSFTDTLFFLPPKSLMGRDTLMCYYDTTSIRSIEGPFKYKWSGGSYNEGIQTHVPPVSTGDVGVTITDTTTGCSVYDFMKISRTPFFPKSSILVNASSNEKIVSTECAVGHQWRLNGQLLPDTGCVLIPKDTGLYSVATYANGCVSNIYSGAGGYYRVTSIPRNVKWIQSVSQQPACTDSIYVVKWTASPSINRITIRVQRQNETIFNMLASGINAATGQYRIDLRTALLDGPVKFRIEDEENNLVTDTMTVRIGLKPAVTLGRDLFSCQGKSTILKGPVGVGYVYVWSTGSSNREISVSPDTTTSYTLTLTSPAGCIDRDTVKIFVQRMPTPVIMPDTSGKLFTNFCGMTHRWFLNNQVIAGETNCVLEIKKGGIYMVMLTDSVCEGPVSDSIMIEQPIQKFITGPNPASGQLMVSVTIPVSARVNIGIFNRNGTSIYQKDFGNQSNAVFKTQIDLSFINKGGLYLMRTTVGNKVYIEKIVVIR